MEPLFKKQGYKVPKVRVSCGFPSSRALSRKNTAIGECWSKSAATDGVCQIFISPLTSKAVEAVDTLVHEIVHAVVGNDAGHGKVFRKCALAVGLTGKMTEAEAGKELLGTIAGWVKALGGYPHASLKPGRKPKKTQTTRMVKCECEECGYAVRTSRKWLAKAGAPLCPCNEQPMSYKVPAELEEDK